MKFTLRQARNLEIRLRNLEITQHTVQVRAYDGEVAEQDLRKGYADLQQEIYLKIDISDIRHCVKSFINVANMECGVSTLLNQRDSIYARLSLIGNINSSDTIERQLEYMDANPAPTRMACAVGEELLEIVKEIKEDARKELDEISGKLLELNNSVEIELSDEDVDILVEFGVLQV